MQFFWNILNNFWTAVQISFFLDWPSWKHMPAILTRVLSPFFPPLKSVQECVTPKWVKIHVCSFGSRKTSWRVSDVPISPNMWLVHASSDFRHKVLCNLCSSLEFLQLCWFYLQKNISVKATRWVCGCRT